jgi:hypothetical protein
VKLLRVLQSREFQRIGETEPRRFAGKVIAATQRNPEKVIAAGGFRADLYDRLCADLIKTPTQHPGARRLTLASSPAWLAGEDGGEGSASPTALRRKAGRAFGPLKVPSPSSASSRASLSSTVRSASM